jgi:acetoin utilization deacetylase AcuC-like enzyme
LSRPVAIITNSDQGLHFSPGHPERPDRVRAILERVRSDGELPALQWLEPGRPSRDLAVLVHTQAEIDAVEAMAADGGGWFDADTYCTADSFNVALSAARCAADATEAVLRDEFSAVFVAARPPGHHATATRPMGFCLFNSAAISAQLARQRGAERVAVVDIDVHHGNGTQDIFYDDPTVLYTSVHQYPWYPGTGDSSERGGPNAEGATINVPVPAGTDGERWLELFDEHIVPAVDAFAPSLIVVSAGYDAHADDPLAELLLTVDTYRDIAQRVRDLSEAHAGGRSVWVLEGGYDLAAISESVAACLQVLAA